VGILSGGNLDLRELVRILTDARNPQRIDNARIGGRPRLPARSFARTLLDASIVEPL
jgi:hypothetical protein